MDVSLSLLLVVQLEAKIVGDACSSGKQWMCNGWLDGWMDDSCIVVQTATSVVSSSLRLMMVLHFSLNQSLREKP